MKDQHTDRKYREELRRLRRRLLAMTGRVEEMIAHSVESLVERDEILAEETISADNQVNRDEIETDELCLIILAKWQPMATDLRFITQAMKMVTDLERIGDLAVNVCERSLQLSREPALKPYVEIPRMAEIVQKMLRDAVDAFIEGDAQKAQTVIDSDDEVDRIFYQAFKNLLGLMMQDEAHVERGMQIQSVSKVLERMADHCTNLAEQVIFLVKGEDVRHIGKLGKQ